MFFLFGQTAFLQWKGDVVIYGSGTKQIEMLEDHTNLSAYFPQPFFIQLCQFRAVYGHSTFCGTFQQVDASYQGGFSGTGKPDDTKNLTLFNIQTYLPYGMDFSAAGAEGFAYLLQLYHVYFLLSAIKKLPSYCIFMHIRTKALFRGTT